jgi:hypothetical protein
VVDFRSHPIPLASFGSVMGIEGLGLAWRAARGGGAPPFLGESLLACGASLFVILLALWPAYVLWVLAAFGGAGLLIASLGRRIEYGIKDFASTPAIFIPAAGNATTVGRARPKRACLDVVFVRATRALQHRDVGLDVPGCGPRGRIRTSGKLALGSALSLPCIGVARHRYVDGHGVCGRDAERLGTGDACPVTRSVVALVHLQVEDDVAHGFRAAEQHVSSRRGLKRD